MTNNELYLMYNLIADKIGNAIDEARNLLPEDAERAMQEWDKEKNELIDWLLIKQDDRVELRPTGDFVALEPLKNLVYDFRTYANKVKDND